MILKKYFLTTVLLLLWAMNLYGQNNHHLYPTKKQRDSLGKVLDKLIYSDQQYRWMISFGELDEQKIAEFRKMTGDEILERMIAARSNKIGISKFKKDSLTKIQEEIDSSNFSTLIGLIYNFGYPKKYFNPQDVTTMLMHATNKIDDTVLAYLMQEVKENCMPGEEYAILYDRIQLDRKLPEKYFVIQHYDSLTKQSRFGIPRDVEETNKMRKEIGLKNLRNP